jgi:23S rRNA pseudouridine1911/1915/1917 synthase
LLQEYHVTAQETGVRLDQYLASQTAEISRNQVQHLIDQGMVKVNGQLPRASYKVRSGDFITLQIPPVEKLTLVAEDIPLDIVYEDSDLLVVNKPAGLVVHPAAGHHQGTLVNALLHHCVDLTGIGGSLRPGIVHRLDKDTTGLLVVSKNDFAHQFLSAELKARRIKREYLALVHGELREESGLIDAPLGRDPRDRKKMAVVQNDHGRPARTHYRVRERYPGHTLLEVSLETGRTHQIRVHLAFAGYPVAGDPLYGQRHNLLRLTAQALHAYRLTFAHPRSGEQLTFNAPLPPDFASVLAELRAKAGPA